MRRKPPEGKKWVTETYKFKGRSLMDDAGLEMALSQAQAVADDSLPYLVGRLFADAAGTDVSGSGKQDLKSLSPSLNSDTRDTVKSKVRSLVKGKSGKEILSGKRRIPQSGDVPLVMRPAKTYEGESGVSRKRGVSIGQRNGQHVAYLDIFSDREPAELELDTKGLRKAADKRKGDAAKRVAALDEVVDNPDPLGNCELALTRKGGMWRWELRMAYAFLTDMAPRYDEGEFIIGIDIGQDFRTCVAFSEPLPNGSDHVWLNELAMPFRRLRNYREFEYKVRQQVSVQPWRGGHGKRDRFDGHAVAKYRFQNMQEDFARRFVSEIMGMARMSEKPTLIRIEDLTGLGTKAHAKFPYHRIYDLLEHQCKRDSIALQKVPGFYNSRTCSHCWTVNFDFDWEYRQEFGFPEFECPECGFTCDADLNASWILASADYPKIKESIQKQVKGRKKRKE